MIGNMTTLAEAFSTIATRYRRDRVASEWPGVVQYEIAGEGGGTWYVLVEGGVLVAHAGSHASPTVVIRFTDADAYISLQNGTVSFSTLMIDGRMTVPIGSPRAPAIAKLRIA